MYLYNKNEIKLIYSKTEGNKKCKNLTRVTKVRKYLNVEKLIEFILCILIEKVDFVFSHIYINYNNKKIKIT